MTIKELERALGVDRASIRFYEKEGLIAPARLANGYRDYSQDDLDELRRIRLLRRLGVSIDEIRALQAGEKALTAILAARDTALREEASRAAHAAEVCRHMLDERVTYRELNAADWLDALAQDGQNIEASDRLPSAYAHPWRRFAARWIDLMLCRIPVLFVLAVLLRLPNAVIELGAAPLAIALMLVVEPFLLSRWGTTPGKRLCGLILRTEDGELPDYTAAFQRTLGLAVFGLGFGLPVLSLAAPGFWAWRLRREKWYAARAGVAYEPRFYWDDTAQYTVDERDGQDILCGVALAACYGLCIAIAAQSTVPAHHGRLTEAEYRENCAQAARRLSDPTVPENRTTFPELAVTQELELDENGYVERVTITRAGENVRCFSDEPQEETVALQAFAVAGTHRTGLGFLLDQGLWEQAADLFLNEGTVNVGDYTVTAHREDAGFRSTGSGIYFAVSEEGGTLRFVYEIAYTPQ